MSVPPVIYTELTTRGDPLGGIWSEKPFAFAHVVWVPEDAFSKVKAENEAWAETTREILKAAERGDVDEVRFLAARALA